MTNEVEKNKSSQEDEISLKELILKLKEWWQYLWSKKWIIIATGLIGGLLGLAYAYTKKPIYTATTTFVLEGGEKSGGLGAYAGVASMMGIDLGGTGGGIFQGDNILELYKSRTMIEKTLFSSVDSNSNQSLMERYIEVNKLRESWGKKPELANIIFLVDGADSKKMDPKTRRLKDSLSGEVVNIIEKSCLNVIKPDKKLSVIQVDVKSTDEVFAKVFNEQLVKNVNDFYVQTKTKKSKDNVKILQDKTDSIRASMAGAIYNAAVISDATPNMNPTRQVQRAAPMQRAQFSAETNKAVLGELVKNLEMAKIALLKETPLVQIIDKPIYPLIKKKVSKMMYIIVGLSLSMIASMLILLLVMKRKANVVS